MQINHEWELISSYQRKSSSFPGHQMMSHKLAFKAAELEVKIPSSSGNSTNTMNKQFGFSWEVEIYHIVQEWNIDTTSSNIRNYYRLFG